MNKGMTFDRDVLTADEIQLMFDELNTDYRPDLMHLAIFVLLYRCGLRMSEAIGDKKKPSKGLRVKDVDLENRTIRINHGKGDKSHLLAMDERTAGIVEEWLSLREDLIADGKMPEPADDLVFLSRGGLRLDQANVSRRLKQLAKKVGIKKRVHPHGLRHAFAVELLDEGFDAVKIMRMMRHRDLATTMKYLDHLKPQDVVDAMKGREW